MHSKIRKNVSPLGEAFFLFLLLIFNLKLFFNFYYYITSMIITYLTQDGYDKLRAELQELRTKGRADASAAIAEARDKGDLSENAEYDAAKEAQGLLELHISEVEATLANARVLDINDIDTSKVGVFTTVRIFNTKMKKEFTYKLVSEQEADFKTAKISVTSPIGKALLGKVVGEVAVAQTPAGPMELKVLEISVVLDAV